MNREAMIARAAERREPWDVVIIGGGATGAGVAVDAASRGFSVLLVEQHDFGAGTSSRSTKLVHGGVRYLEQGNLTLVMDALRERGRLLRNAPHLVRDIAFLLPTYKWWETPFYGVGLKVYDQLAGKYRFGQSKYLPRREALRRMPGVEAKGLRGAVLYHDGQFDDSRLLINLLQTAVEQGAVVLNYARVVRLEREAGRVAGVVVHDLEAGTEFTAKGRVVVNATGAFCDGVRRMADASSESMIAPSHGSHLVFDRSFLPCDDALIVPHTPDGRVMFAIPWHGRTLVGTTDVGVPSAEMEPRATEGEIDFMLETAGRYLAKKPTRADVKAVFAGVRPLVKASASTTSKLSRDHTIRVESGMLTIAGGKWTTYRKMAEDVIDRAADLGMLPKKPCKTKTMPIHGHAPYDSVDPLGVYGSDAVGIRKLQTDDPTLAKKLHADLPYTGAEVVWCIRNESARTVEDVLSRRLRALMLDASAAMAMAPRVAELLAKERGRDKDWRAEQVKGFNALAKGYLIQGG